MPRKGHQSLERGMQYRLDAARKAWPAATRDNPTNCRKLKRAAVLRTQVDLSQELQREVIEEVQRLEEEHHQHCRDGCDEANT